MPIALTGTVDPTLAMTGTASQTIAMTGTASQTLALTGTVDVFVEGGWRMDFSNANFSALAALLAPFV
jgi:hypothetical protein